MNKPYANLFFDLGWTLEDETGAQEDRALRTAEFCKSIGYRFTAQDVLKAQKDQGLVGFHEVYAGAMRSLGLSPKEFEMLKANVRWDITKACLFQGAAETVRKLSGYFYLAMIANQSARVDARLSKYGILDCFGMIHNSSEIGISKPDIRIFEQAYSRLPDTSIDVWMIGDRIDNDIVPAKTMGWRTVRVRLGDHAAYEPADGEKPEFQITDIRDLDKILFDQYSIKE